MSPPVSHVMNVSSHETSLFSTVRSRLRVTYMRQYDDLVPGEVNVRLDGMCADIDGGTECAERVFRICGLVASVRDSLRQVDAAIGP